MKSSTLVVATLSLCSISAGACLAAPSAIALAEQQELQSVTVAAMIERPYVDADSLGDRHDVYNSPIASFSPSKRRFIVATYSPDIKRQAEVVRLHLFEAADINPSTLHTDDKAPLGRVVFEAEVRQDHHRVRSIRWHGEDEISFLAPGPSGALQVFRGKPSASNFEQVTAAKNDIYQYAYAGRDLILMEEVPHEEGQYQPRLAASHMGTTLGEILEGRPGWGPGMPIVQLTRQRFGTGQVSKLQIPAMLMFPMYQQMFPSPSGRFLALRYPATEHPSHWSEYGGAGRYGISYSTQYNDAGRSSDPTSPLLQHRHRWMLLDLQTGEFRPLMDAPAAHVEEGGHGTVHWTADSSMLVFTKTALPLTNVPLAERKRRRASLAAVAVDVRTGSLTPLAYFGPGERRSSSPDARMVTWNQKEEALVIPLEQDGTMTYQTFRRASQWRPTSIEASQSGLELKLRQDLNARPRLYAHDSMCDCDTLVLDPDPAADAFSMVPTEIFEWKDSNGLAWTGGLLRPAGYKAGKRYPLIVQTHGFTPDRPLLTGPQGANAAFAAQAFANAGFLVLQIEDKPDDVIPHVRAAPGYGEGYRAAIQELAAAGLADADRVGIIAWSATGLGITYLLTQYPDMVTAATYADATTGEPFMGLMNLGLDDPFPAYGPTFKDVPMGEWWETNMLSRIQNTRAAIRLEAYSPDSVIAMWEAYALLKGYRRPAEFLYLPGAEHDPFNPAHRMVSQGGNFDWMRFWLQGLEDSDPAKAQQYARWRMLRELAQRSMSKSSPGDGSK